MQIHKWIKIVAGVSFASVYLSVVTESGAFETVNLQDDNCKLVEVVKSQSILDQDQYKYRCDNNIAFTVNFEL